jgi:hypothetical protein
MFHISNILLKLCIFYSTILSTVYKLYSIYCHVKRCVTYKTGFGLVD